MSQAGNYEDDSSIPDIETITADSGGPVSSDAAFNLNLLGGANVTTVGNPATNTITILQSGGTVGTGQTIGAVTDDTITFPLGATPGTYNFHIKVTASEPTTPAGAVYEITAGARTTGAAGTLIGAPVVHALEEAALVSVDPINPNATMVVVGNSAIVRVLGTVGLTVDWNSELDSIFQS